MTVYADVLVIVNLYIDYFLLWTVKRFLGLRTGKGRLALGALTGGILSLSALIPQMPQALSPVISLGTALLTTAAAFCPMKLKNLILSAIYFWAFTLLLAGFFLFLLRFFTPGSVAVLGNVLYFDLSPALLFFFTCGAYGVLALLRRVFPGKDQSLRCCWITVKNKGSACRIYAKADTGNALKEPFSGLPVIVCTLESLKDCVPPEAVEFSSQGSCRGTAGLRIIPFETVGGKGVLPAFQPESAEACGQELSCYIAVCRHPISAGQYDAIFNPDLFPGCTLSQKSIQTGGLSHDNKT